MSHMRKFLKMGEAAGVLGGGAAVVDPAVIYDKFTGVDASNLNTRLPDTKNNGNTWIVASGTVTISGGRATPGTIAGTNGSIGVIDAGLTAYTITCNIQINLTKSCQVMCRYVDVNNFWIADYNTSTNSLTLYERNAGTYTLRASNAAAGILENAIATITVTAGAITASCDATSITYASTLHNTSTKLGIRATDAGSYCDNFKVVA